MKYSIALAYRSGVSRSPSRVKSSPIHSITVRAASASFRSRISVSSDVDFKRPIVPGPDSWFSEQCFQVASSYLQGQLRPSRSIGGLLVLAIVGLSRAAGVVDRPPSKNSRAELRGKLDVYFSLGTLI